MKKQVFILMALISATVEDPEAQAQRISRDLNVDLLINQAGYVPHAGKTIVTKGM